MLYEQKTAEETAEVEGDRDESRCPRCSGLGNVNEFGSHMPCDSCVPKPRPTIVCLCGSTRFSHAFRKANLHETLAGRIVLSIGCDMRSDADLFADLDEAAITKIKTDLDELHKRKIDLADEVLVVSDKTGYIGDSTRSEIAYAEQLGKPIRWLEPTA